MFLELTRGTQTEMVLEVTAAAATATTKSFLKQPMGCDAQLAHGYISIDDRKTLQSGPE